MNMWSGSAGDLVSMLPLEGNVFPGFPCFFQSGSSGMERISRLIKSCLRGGGGDEAVERGWVKPRGQERQQEIKKKWQTRGGVNLVWLQTIP